MSLSGTRLIGCRSCRSHTLIVADRRYPSEFRFSRSAPVPLPTVSVLICTYMYRCISNSMEQIRSGPMGDSRSIDHQYMRYAMSPTNIGADTSRCACRLIDTIQSQPVIASFGSVCSYTALGRCWASPRSLRPA
jgi:hypothetical protein